MKEGLWRAGSICICFLFLSSVAITRGFEIQSLYIGCFAESPIHNREFNVSAGNYDSANLQPFDCASTCGSLGYKYAALQAGSFCFCANSYGVHGHSSNCSTLCTGNPSLTCGGFEANAVYNASGYSTNLVLHVQQQSQDLELFARTNISASLENDPGSPILAKFNVGDVSGVSPALKSALNFRVIKWGLIGISAESTTSNLPRKTYRELHINSPISGATIECCAVISTTKKCSCRVDVLQGTNVQANWQFQDGPVENISLPNPSYVSAGPAVPQWDVAPLSQNNAGVFLMASSQFTSEASLLALEMYGHTAGKVKVFLARPLCTQSSDIYCASNMSCLPIGSSCEPFTQFQCAQNQTLCASRARCHEASDANCSAPAVSTPKPGDVYYQIYHVFKIDVDKGYNLQVLTTNQTVQVSPGDILGWVSDGGGQIARVQGEGRSLQYSGLSSGDITPKRNINHNESFVENVTTFRVRAIASKGVTFSIVKQLTSPGVYKLQANLSNLLTGFFSLGTQHFTVQQPVTSIQPLYSDGFNYFGTQVNQVFQMLVNVSAASNLTITWKLNGSVLQVKEYTTDLPSPYFQDSLNHTFSDTKEFEIIVTASNNVSLVNTTLIVKVLSSISKARLSLAQPGSLVYRGAPTEFNASAAGGNNIKFAWQFGNEARTEFSSNDSITHRFSHTGAHNVTVTASNLASEVQASLVVNVQESVSVEGPASAIADNLVNFTCNLTGPFNSNSEYFYWHYGDGAQTDEGAGKMHVQHKYAKGGTYRVECRVRNEVLLNSSVEIVVTEAVTGLRLKNISGVELNETQTFIAITDTGNQLSYVWYIQGESTIFLSVCFNNSIDFRFNETGIYTVSVNVSNSISSQYTSMTFPVHVRISGLGITADPNPAPSNTTVTFNVTKGTGSNVTYRLDFGDGFVARKFGEIYQFNRTFQASRWQIILTGQNSVSHMIVFYNLTVQDVVKNPMLSVESVKSFGGLLMVATGSSDASVFHANASQGTDVYFTWNFKNKLSNAINSYKYKGDLLTSGATKSLVKHTFVTEAIYNVSVLASNDVSSLRAWVLVQAQEMLQGFQVHSDDAVEPGETLRFSLTKTSGGNVTYLVDYGDGENQATRKETLDKTYAKIGVYTVMVIAQNQISSATVTKLIYVQYKIRGLQFTKPLAPVALGNSSVITWSVTNGTNITYIVDFGDGQPDEVINSSLVEAEMSLQHTFSSSGKYTVTIKAYNRIKPEKSISDIALVEKPIRSLKLYALGGNVTLFDDVIVRAVIAQGENVLYRYDFGDETDHVESAKSEEKHTYKRVGVFMPTVRAWNSISSVTAIANTSINVVSPSNPLEIRGLTLSCEPTAFGNVTQIKVQYDHGYLFQCEIKFGDGNSEEHKDTVLHKPITHSYSATGEFEVTATCSNNLGSERATVIAHVDTSITGLKFTAKNKDIDIDFGHSLNVNWTWTTGTNVKFSVSLSTGVSLRPKVGSFVASVSIGNDSLPKPDIYILTVNATNSLTPSRIITVRIVARESITGLKMTINPNARARFPMSLHAIITTGSPVNLRWVYGDGNEMIPPKENEGKVFRSTYAYRKAGNFTMYLIAWNKISEQNVSQVLRVFNPVEAFTFLTPKSPIWPSRSIQLTFARNTSIPPPTDATYSFNYGNGQSSITFKLDPEMTQASHNYTFPLPGCYNVKLLIENKVSHLTLVTKVQINTPISEFNVVASHSKYSAHPGAPGGGRDRNVFPVEYPVSFAISHQNGTCVDYVWTFGDFSANASGAVVSHVYPLPGTYTVRVNASNAVSNKQKVATRKVVLQRSILGLFLATSNPSKLGESVSFIVFCAQCGSDSKFLLTTGDEPNPKKLERPNRAFKPQDEKLLGQNFKLPFNPSGYNITIHQHKYKSTGVFEAQVQAYNDASNQTAIATVVVSAVACSLPRVKVLGGADSISSAPSFTYGRDFTLTSEVNIDCVDYDAAFAWTLYTANTFYAKNSDALSLPPEATRVRSFPRDVITNQSYISISQPLEPGTYIAQLTVRIQNVGVENADRKYIKISAPDIIPYIAGGSARSHGWADELVLNASQSRDPLTAGNEGLIFEWFCKYAENTAKYVDNSLGCFGNGRDQVEFEGAVFKVGPRMLFESLTYEFEVKVSSSDRARTSSTLQAITVKPGSPPDVRIRCIHNCGSKITPSERLVLTAECSNCAGNQSLSFYWTLFNASSPRPPAIWPDRALTRQTSSNLVILGDTFEAGVAYTLRITVTRTGGLSGFSDYERKTNEGPRGGHCDVTPKSGKELDTKFSFTCRAWKDEDLPLTYEILYSRGVEGGEQELVAYSPTLKNTTAIFSAGREESNHSLKITIRVKDVYGAWTTTSHSIQVFPHRAISRELLNLTVGDGNKLSHMMGAGDVQGAVQLISVIGNMLNTNNNVTTQEDGKQIRSSLVDALDKMRPLNLDDVTQMSRASKTVTDVTSELTVASQVKISNTFVSMKRLVVQKAEEDEKDSGVIQQVCTAMLGGLANVIKASSAEENGEEASSIGLKVIQDLNDAMFLTKMTEENATIIKVPGLTVSLNKQSPDQMAASTISTDEGEFRLPAAESLFRGVVQREAPFLTAAMTELTYNPHSRSNSSARIQSSVLSLVLKGPEGKMVPVKDLTSPIDIILPRKNGDSQMKKPVNISRTPLTDGQMSIHRVTLPRSENTLLLDITPEDRMSSLTVYLRYNEKPSETEHDLKRTLPQNSTRYQHGNSYAHHTQTPSVAWDNSSTGLYTLFVPREYLKGDGTYFIGVLPADKERKPINYTFQVHSSGCYYWNETLKEWTDDGCEVGDKTNTALLHCQCTHLTWFGADLFVPPNKLDIGKSLNKMKNLHEYPALLATFCSIAGLYLLCLIWARRKDKADLKKVGLVVVSDCDSAHEYRYEVTVYTGRGKHAGTTANVSFVMSGEQDQTRAHTLNDETRPVLQAGGVDSFLLTTSGSLGSLTYIRVWHDNSGKSPSWYLSQIVVRDIETEEKFFFLCDRWFACDEGDGQVDRLIPAAGKEELSDFMHLFRTKTTRDLSNNHLWFSVAFRPARSQFTRAQRVTCCLSLLMCTMLVNVMWYQVPVKAQNNVIIDAGFFTFTWHQFIIGIQSSLIVFPINLLIVQLFRNVRVSPRAKKVYLGKVAGSAEQHYTQDRAVSLSQITTSTSRKGSVVSQLQEKNLFTGKRKPGLERMDSDEEMFSCLLQTKPKWMTESSDNIPLKVTKNPKIEDNTELEYLTTDAIYQLLYNSEAQTGKERAKTCVTTLSEETPVTSPDHQVSDARPLVKESDKQRTVKNKKKKRQWCKFVLPWWFVFVSWFLCLSTAVVAGFFTLLWGLSFSLQKQEEWLASLFVSIINDIFISQPLKVICFAIFFALIFKRPQEEEDDVINAELAQDEEWLQQNLAQKRGTTPKDPAAYHPPDQVMLKKARLARFKERKMHKVLREILFYFLFVWIVLLIAYGHRDPNAPFMTRSTEDIFVGNDDVTEHQLRESAKRQKSNHNDHRLVHVTNVPDFWTWVDEVLIPGLYNNTWYNGANFGATGFISDRASIIIGVARLRQLRVEDDTCEVASVIVTRETHFVQCHEPYSWGAEDRTNHYPGWKPANQSLPDVTENSAWHYRTATELKGHPILGDFALYRGSGYVAEFGLTAGNVFQIVNELKSRNWVDENTRAVFVEFTIYNGNTNIYSVVNFLLEFTATGGSFPFVQVLATRIDRYVGNMKLFVLACEVAFVLFTIYFTYHEVKRLLKSDKKVYLSEFWTWIELALVSLSWTVIVLYFIRFTLDKLTKSEIQANRDSFVNFHYLATTDQVYGYVYAFVVFFISIKILRLFRFNRRMSLLGSTIRASFKELFHFGIIFGLVFVSFAHLCYLVFSRELEKFSTFLSTLETLLSVMLGKFSYLNFQHTNRILGPFMFFFYTLGVVFILMNMFLSIIIENFRAVKSHNDLQSNEHEIVSFMLDQFKAWLGLNSWRLFSGRVQDAPKPVYKKRKKVHKAEELKERVDRLVTLIRKVHFNVDEEGDFLRNDGEVTYQIPTFKYDSLS